MAEKRKVRQSTRRYGEPPLKKRILTTSPAPELSEPADEGLPSRLRDNQDLPALLVQQDQDLCSKEYQSIAESGVLALSLERSRQRWLSDGIFERYWAKPSKKRPPVDSQNPAKESMTKLGVCSMIIEPHVFETTLYTVREIQSHFIPPKPLPQPPPPPPDMRYSSFSHVAIYPPATRVTSASLNHQDQQHRNSSQLTLPTFNEGFAHLGSQGPPHHNLLSAPDRTESVFGNTGISDTRQDDRNEKPNDDPVIQMLATRAASNHDLKSLMRVVASGNATQTQLKDFQNHIDELNDILKTRHKENQSPYGAEHGLRTISSTNKQAPSNQSLPSDSTFGVGYAPNVKTARVASTSAPKPLKQESSPQYFSHYMQPLKSKNTTSYKSEISSIVFDLGGGGDRFSFPRLSILEYLPGGTQVIVSFLVIRRGSTAVSKGYKETASYYEPITMRLSSHQPRVLEPLSRVVAPPDEVRQYMDSVFDKMDPAEKVFLAIRLPRTKENTSTEKEDTSVQPQPAEIKLTYSPPNALVPIAA